MAHETGPDPFFNLTDDSEWNACVGPQGYELNYVDGYLEAAHLLVTELITQERLVQRDTLAMPILYNTRHSIELLLKYVLRELAGQDLILRIPPTSHNIKAYWDALASSPLGDEALVAMISELSPFVMSLATIDKDGQELRYSHNRDGATSLAHTPLVNLKVIRDGILSLKRLADALKMRLEAYIDERRTGTFTAACSRRDLGTIARMLPQRNEWGSKQFTEAKARICTRFRLSGRQFTAALDLIQKNREMGRCIGIQYRLMHLSSAQLLEVVGYWFTLHPRREITVGSEVDYFTRGLDEVRTHSSRFGRVQDILLTKLSTAEIADLQTIYYIGRDKLYSERYETMVTSAHHSVRDAPKEALRHVMSKTNMVTAVMEGLSILGCSGLACDVQTLVVD